MNPPNKTLVIAEIGINHNRSLDEAKKLVDACIRTGADVIKTQLEEPTEYCLTFAETKDLADYCKERKIDFACTPFDVPSLEFLLNNTTMPFLKIASRQHENIELLKKAGECQLPVVLSTGACTNDMIAAQLDIIGSSKVTLMHCVSSYPAPIKESNLRAIDAMRLRYHLPVGFSDHSLGINVALAAVAMGAVCIEKHITRNRGALGPDHAASIEPRMFTQMVSAIREIDLAKGEMVKQPQPSEAA